MNKSVECHGNDLATTCDGLRHDGHVIESLDASVGGKPAMYRVNYFERAAELADASVEDCNPSVSGPSRADEGSTPSALTIMRSGIAEESGKRKSLGAPELLVPDCGSIPQTAAIPEPESIESRMAKLKSKAVAAGMVVKDRPYHRPGYARQPYVDK